MTAPRGGAGRFGGAAEAPIFRLRHVPLAGGQLSPLRRIVAVVCLILGVGLVGGVGTGFWFSGDADAETSAEAKYDETRQLWHEVPVDTLFPRTIEADGDGPGNADRVWKRVAVAPDSTCTRALDPLLTKTLAPVGCERLVRATYTDDTHSSVTTVGLLFTEASRDGMRKLRHRFVEESLAERADLMPRTYPARGTVAATFGDAQRASWTIDVLADAPVVVYAVSGFADGRTVGDPQPAQDATAKGQTSSPAQAGLGHAAQSIARSVEHGLRQEFPGTTDTDNDTESAS